MYIRENIYQVFFHLSCADQYARRVRNTAFFLSDIGRKVQ